MITKKEQEANELKHFNKAAGKLSAVALSAGALALSCPTYAFASQEGGIQAILPEMSEFIPMLVAFIILWIVLAKFGWPVFDKMLEKRANSIRDDLKNAEEASACLLSTSSSSLRPRFRLPKSSPMPRRPAKT